MVSVNSKGFKPLLSFGCDDDILIDLTQKFGEWSHGSYYKGFSKSLNKKVMVKVVDLKKFPLSKTCLDTELALLKKLENNPYSLKLLAHKYYPNTLSMAFDVCNKGSLREYLQQNGTLLEEKAVYMLLQLVYGLKSLHDNQFSHGALRPENILVHEENGNITLKLSNFIYAHSYSTSNKVNLPSGSMYIPPEVLKTSRYNIKSDIWSLGMIYYEMLYGNIPWLGKDAKELETNILDNPLEFPENDAISETSVSFISKCLERELEKRMDWSDMMQHRLVFRGLFSNGNGTYKLFNQEFKDQTVLNKKLVYGMRRESPAKNPAYNSSKSVVLPSDNTKTQVKRQQTIACPQNLLDENALQAGQEYGYVEPKLIAQTNSSRSSSITKEEKAKPSTPSVSSQSRISRNISRQATNDYGYVEPKVKTRNNSAKSPSVTRNERAKPSRLAHSPSIKGPKFYGSLLTKTEKATNASPIRIMNLSKNPNLGELTNAFSQQFKWLMRKADMLSEVHGLASENKGQPLYDKILKTLNKEMQTLDKGLGTAGETSEKFNKGIDNMRTTSSRAQSASKTNPKPKDSITKKVKSKEIYEILTDIMVDIINSKTEEGKENLLKIAANLKILREFEEVGDNVARELESLKDILLLFYRKKQFDHLKYLLLVKNYA